MLVLLLFAIRAAGEWVEISQQQHRADPMRRTSTASRGADRPNNVYANYSLTEHAWHISGLSRTPNIGTVRRVQLQGKVKSTSSMGEFPESAAVKVPMGDRGYDSIGPVGVPNTISKEILETKNVIRKYNLDNSKKINEPDKYNPSRYSDLEDEEKTMNSPTILNANTKQIITKNKYLGIDISAAEDNVAETSYVPLKINSTKHVHSGPWNGVEIDKEAPASRNLNSSGGKNKARPSPAVKTGSSDVIRNTTNESLVKNQSAPPPNPYSKSTKKDGFSESDKLIRPNPVARKHVSLDGHTKTKTVEVIWKLMSVVTDNIVRNTRRGFRNKIRYLEDLRNDILANIAERVEQVWPDEAGPPRRKRNDDAARGHVEFPSSESALMTISFLTFAVFLIKLVLQVIHTYKNKTMMVTPAVVAAVGRAAATLKQQTLP